MAGIIQENKLSAANGNFALALYRHQSAATAGNIFMSPLSISVALAMTYVGAVNNTKSQMREAMHFGEVEDEELHQTFSVIRQSLNKPDQPYKLYMANRLFGEKTYNFLESFLATTDKHYAARLEPVDFIGDSNGATDLINDWVAENTSQKITKLLSPGILNDLTRLVLANAVYFKGDWAKKFNASNTKEEDFHVSPAETVRVQLMHVTKGKFVYGVNHKLNCMAIELPYCGDQLSMIVLLPDSVTTLQDVESSLTADDLLSVNTAFRMSLRDVHLWLPKFRLDEKLGLTEILSAMGMTDMFDERLADFSGIDGSRELHVSNVVHQAVVDVNEEGTEAAAATAVVIATRCMVREPFEFRADRPFMFFIRDNKTNSILFLGRLVNPKV